MNSDAAEMIKDDSNVWSHVVIQVGLVLETMLALVSSVLADKTLKRLNREEEKSS